ncbi:MAG: hypothetical protein Q7S36_03670 [Candidatus Liptonbacteria bacterium]|nr:hypothetical protein [Candidatus Liptonbacteria bacterium]
MRLKILLCALLAFLALKLNGETPCDLSLMRFVHGPKRLKVLSGCVTVRGVVAKRLPVNPWDGDYHVNIKLDPEFEHLLNDFNRKNKKGALVVEFVCQSRFALKKEARKVCVGYSNRLQLPKVGDYIEITGIHVEDLKHGHNEIHPPSGVTVIKRKGARP